MDRCALFVDAGYMLADGAMAVHGTRRRESVSWDYEGLLQLLGNLARDRTGLPLLRCYWYEATVEGRRTAQHDVLADMPGIKLRLAKMRPGRREGVGAEIQRDLTVLARNGAVSDAVVVSVEEDLGQAIADVQDLGMRVTLANVAVDGAGTVARALRQECDDLMELTSAHLRPYVDRIADAEPTRVAGAEPTRPEERAQRGPVPLQPIANGRSMTGAPSYQPLPPDAGAVDHPDHVKLSGRPDDASRSAPSPLFAAPVERYPRPIPPPPAAPARSADHDPVGAAGPTVRAEPAELAEPSAPGGDRPGEDDSLRGWERGDARSAVPQDVYAAPVSLPVRKPAPPRSTGAGEPPGGGGPGRPPRTGDTYSTPGELAPRPAGLPPAQPVPGREPPQSVPLDDLGHRGQPGEGSAPGVPGRPDHRSGSSGSNDPRVRDTDRLASRPPPIPARGAHAGPPASPAEPWFGDAGRMEPQEQLAPGVQAYVPAQNRPYGGPHPPVRPGREPAPAPVSLPEAVRSAYNEGQEFGDSVARDAPALWMEAVLARKPRMPSDLEARLLQGSVLPIDFLLHDEVRHALRRGFWDALERSRRLPVPPIDTYLRGVPGGRPPGQALRPSRRPVVGQPKARCRRRRHAIRGRPAWVTSLTWPS